MCTLLSGHAYLVIDSQLILQDTVPFFVDRIGLRSFVLLPGVDGTPFTVPDAQATLVHPLPLLLVATLETPLLRLISDVGFWRVGEAENGVVMDRIRGVLPSLVSIAKVGKVRGKRISVQEEGMMRINLTDCLIDSIVEVDNTGVVRIGGLVQRVVASDPGVVLVVFGEFLPEPDDSVLVVLVNPEVGNVGSRIRVPISILASRGGVKVKNSINTVLCTEIDDPIEVLETFWFQHTRVHIIYFRM